MSSEDGGSVRLGDVLRIERRVNVDGAIEKVLDNGRYKGVELVGSTEHIVLEDAEAGTLRLFPLNQVSEIAVVAPVPREPPAPAPSREAVAAPWDPGFA